MKKRIIIAIIILLTLALTAMTACGAEGGGGSGDGNGAGNGAGGGAGGTTVADTDDDPCPCCPDCIQKECECAECGESDDCECSMPRGSAQPLTYDIGIKTELKETDPTCPYPGECGGVSSGSAKVTMNWDDSKNGYFGISQDGFGEYLSFASHYWDSAGRTTLGHVSPGTTFDFSTMLAIPNAGKDGVIRVGFNFYGEDDVTMHWDNGEVLPFWGMMGMIQGWFSGTYTIAGTEFDSSGLIDPETFEYDQTTGMWILDMPLKDGDMKKTFNWDTAGLTITVTLTPAG